MNIGLDIMGGDYAPESIVKGAVMARQEIDASDNLILFGPQEKVENLIIQNGDDPAHYSIVNTTQVIQMGEQPTRAITQKTDSGIAKGFYMLKNKKIDSFASAGNTGAMLVGAIYSVNVIQGIIRPATTSVLPKENGGIGVLIDVGTNPDSKPDVMYQFGILGSIYARNVYGISKPKVALLNIGSEEEKGNLLTQSAFRLMKNATEYDFVGNVESRDLFNDKADVIVCDGFTGNVLIKQAELMYQMIRERGFDDPFFERMNYENYGGTPILGVNGTVVIGHGISNDKAIKNMVLLSKDVHEARIADKISMALSDSDDSKTI